MYYGTFFMRVLMADLRALLRMRAFSAVRSRRLEFCLASTVRGLAAVITMGRADTVKKDDQW